jgi:hypothetical protein
MFRSATRVVLLVGLAAIALTACVAEPYPAYAQPTYAAPYPYYGPYYGAPVYRPYGFYSFSYRSGPPRYYHRYHHHRSWRDGHRHWGDGHRHGR